MGLKICEIRQKESLWLENIIVDKAARCFKLIVRAEEPTTPPAAAEAGPKKEVTPKPPPIGPKREERRSVVPTGVFKGIVDEDATKVVDGVAPKVIGRNASIEQVKKFYNLSDCTQLEVILDSSSFVGNKQVKDNKIDLFVQKYKEFAIFDEETIDCAFARFNTIIISLKALDKSFSSRNHVRNFLRALPTICRPKVTAIKESKDLSTLPLDELIGNLKVYEVVLEKDSEASKIKKEKYKSLALKERKVSSDEEESCSGSDEEYAMAVKDFKKFFKRRGKFVRQPYDDKKNIRKVKGGKKGKKSEGVSSSDSEEEDDSKKDKIYLVALDNNVLSDTLYYSSSSLDSESLQNEYNKLCKISLGIINKNKLLKTKNEIIDNKVRLKVKLEPDEWIKYIGCSRHIMGNKDLFSTYEAINGGNIVFGSNTKSKIIEKGTLEVVEKFLEEEMLVGSSSHWVKVILMRLVIWVALEMEALVDAMDVDNG
ncbi:hypothetical protein Tco_1253595 [Tanacetum coccineum]